MAFNVYDSLAFAIHRVEVRRRMITEIHLDDDAVETR
jgi:hypothetical protein